MSEVAYGEQRFCLKKPVHGFDNDLEKECQMLKFVAGAGGAPLFVSYRSRPQALLMTQIPGMTVAQFTNSISPSPYFTLRVFCRACERLAELHQIGVMHLDLHEGNVMVSGWTEGEDVDFRFIDFGWAVQVA